MAVPQSTDYRNAIQNPHLAFRDAQLRESKPAVNGLGLPLAWSGNFAVIYQLCSLSSDENWAVKCFTRDTPGLAERYRTISRYLGKIRLPFLIPFQFLEQGVLVSSNVRPILKMPWIEGIPLHDFVREALDKPDQLRSLARIWVRMSRKLRDARIAHGDLQHGNVLLVRSSADSNLHLKLVDYDGMHVPEIKGTSSGESGHPAYQHPERLRTGICNSEIDRFSILAVYTALVCLRSVGRSLWNRYDNADNLLFREEDYRSPGTSPLFQELWLIPDLECRSLVGRLILACDGSLAEVPLLDDLVDRNRNLPLSREESTRVSRILASSQPLRRSPRSVAEEEDPTYRLKGVDEGDWWSETLPPAPPVPKQHRQRKSRFSADRKNRLFLIGAIGVLVIVGWLGLSTTLFPVIEEYESPKSVAEVPQDNTRTKMPLETSSHSGNPPISELNDSSGFGVEGNRGKELLTQDSTNRSLTVLGKDVLDPGVESKGSKPADSVNQENEAVSTNVSDTQTPEGGRQPPPTAIAPFNAEKARQHQEAWAKYLGVDVEITNSIGMKLTLIPPADYSPSELGTRQDAEGNKTPDQRIKVTRPFYLGKTEVTWKEWRNGGMERRNNYITRSDDDDYPVQSVDYSEAAEFCQLLSRKEDALYRLPTVVEWEYARKGGSIQNGMGSDWKDYAWSKEFPFPHQVALKKP